jgi:hypothetical protein
VDVVEFDPGGETERLQDAVRRHDRPLLEQLLSDRFAFVSGRALGRLDKERWIAAALRVEWRSFAVAIVRVIDLGDVVIVDLDIEQEMTAPPGWAPDAPTHSRWNTTDVWVTESGTWRLASRHPEITA